MIRVLGHFARAVRWIGQRMFLLCLLSLAMLTIEAEGPPPNALDTGIDQIIADVRFDFWRWEAEAVWAKFTHWLLQPQRYMEEPDRSAFVRDYAARVAQLRGLQSEIETIYADPDVIDPDVATAQMRADLAQLRAEAAVRQSIAEAIVEEQVGVILADEGIGYLGRPFPSVGSRFTPLPYLLVISPRDRIVSINRSSLQHGMDLALQESIEDLVDETFDVSSLITRIGGLSAWPAMLLESSNLPWIMEVTAHEWTHHYLTLYPLGWEYDQNYEARTINETTASIVGREVGRAVLALYYPDLLPPEVAQPSPEQEPSDPPAFDFRTEMYTTRVEVDSLLAEGLVEEAERYMEERRQFFWQNGYRIRKLNQAYFAFYGSYADEPGASGEDPTGPAVLRLRQQSPSLRSFLARIDGVTTLAELEQVLEKLEE